MRRKAAEPKGPPKPITINRPPIPVGALASAYEWMTKDEEVAFSLAFGWYSENVHALLFGDPFDADRQRAYDRAVKARTLGDQGTTPGEKRQAWTTALRLFEKAWEKHGLPKVDEVRTPSKDVEAVANLIADLNAVFASHGVRFRPSAGKTKELVENSISLPIESLRDGRSPLQVVLSEVPTVAKAISVKETPNGKALDGLAFMANLDAVLRSAGEWASGNANAVRATKIVAKATVPKTASGVSGTRTHSTRPAGTIFAVDPFGIFRRNTAKAAVAEVLDDGAFHSMSELEALCEKLATSKGQARVAVSQLEAKGIKIERRGKEVRASR